MLSQLVAVQLEPSINPVSNLQLVGSLGEQSTQLPSPLFPILTEGQVGRETSGIYIMHEGREVW